MKRFRIAVGSIVLALAFAAGAAGVAQADDVGVQAPAARCGFEEVGYYAFYYNCVNKNILIRIDVNGQGSDNDRCEWVGPWERVQIGESSKILNAYALGSGRCNI
jgi:Family of unknown function (DUF6355)